MAGELKRGRIGRARRTGTFGAGAGTRLALAQLRTVGRSDDRKTEVLTETHRALSHGRWRLCGAK